MSMGKVQTTEVPAILDSETMAVLRQLDPNAKPGAEYDAHVRQKLARRAYEQKRKEQAFEGPTDDLEYPAGPARMNPNESIYGQAVSAAGAVNAPNVVGGIAPLLALGLPLLPGIIGAIGSAIPKIAGLFRRRTPQPPKPPPQAPSTRRYLPARPHEEEPEPEDEPEDEPEGGEGGAVRPPNWGYGGMGEGDGAISALVGAGERIASALETARAGPEFWSMLAEGTREELPAILEATDHKIPPRNLPFVISRVMKRIGLPDSFTRFMRSEVMRRRQRRGRGEGEGEGGEGGEGEGEDAAKAHARLVRPLLKYVAYRATRDPKGAGALYSSLKEHLREDRGNPFLAEVKAASGEGGPRRGPSGLATSSRGFAARPEGPRGSLRGGPRGRRGREPMDDDLYGSTGQTAKRVIGSVLSSSAAPGSAALGKAADVALGRLFGKETTLGSDIAKSFGSSILGTVGSELQRSAKRDETRARREAAERRREAAERRREALRRQRYEYEEPYEEYAGPEFEEPPPGYYRGVPRAARAPPRGPPAERVQPVSRGFERTPARFYRSEAQPSGGPIVAPTYRTALTKRYPPEQTKSYEEVMAESRMKAASGKKKGRGRKAKKTRGGMSIRVL